jgi:F420H(2)-dependent quinone reductase
MPKSMIRGFSSLHRAMVSMSGGRVGTKFRGQPLILLTTTGRRTGTPRTWPLVGLPIDRQDRTRGWVVAASYGAHDANPAWYLNLQAHPEATVRDGTQEARVRARDATPAERGEHWPRFVDVLDTYAQYQDATDRTIPVVILERQR